ncbi:MAG: VOC family protein [Acidimicrobiia bacterium]
MADVATLLGSIGGGLFQHAYVVADLGAAERSMREALGCSAFVDLPAADLDYELRGERVRTALAIGFARSGDVQIELLQPVRGPGLHAEFLAEWGGGIHHLGFMVDDLDATLAQADGLGIAKLMGGAFGSLRFAYLDTFAELGVYAEVVEDPDGMMASLRPWRD